MRTTLRRLLPLVLVVLILLKVGVVHADVNDFVINNFNADYVLSNADKQGTLNVVESIDLTFSDNNHGIFRAIPNTYKDNNLGISGITVSSKTHAPTQFSESTSNGNIVLKIGDPNKTVTGKQNYIISYTISNVIAFYDNYDEFYWDINGTEWSQPFEKVSMSLAMPPGVVVSEQHLPICFTGTFGSTEKNCDIAYDKTTNTVTAHTIGKLQPNQTMSVVVGFEKGYFMPPTPQEKFKDAAVMLAEIFGIPLLLGGLAYRRWHTHGKDPKGKGVIVAQYDPPDKLLPAEVGAIVDFKIDNKDISATIIDLAIKGYIKITETKKDKKFARDTLEYSFELLTEDTSKLTSYEITLLSALFSNTLSKGAVVDATSLKNKYYTSVSAAKLSVKDRLVSAGYFRSDPSKAGAILWAIIGLSFFAVITFAAVFGPGFVIGLVISIPIVAAFAFAMPARTVLGVQAKEHALGLKMYLEVAEKDRIAALQSPNAPLAKNAHEPVKTVELFEKLLPYAIVFGVEKQWANEFSDIYNQMPNWYNGDVHTFNSIYLANMITGSFGNSMNIAFAAPSSSGSSGFGGGGGFSGGGGGGGGGGGW